MSQQNTTEDNRRPTVRTISKGRLYWFFVLVAVGVAMVFFGSLRSISSSGSEGKALSEFELNQEFTVDGIVRSETGELQKKTYQKGEKPPQACPT